MLDGFFTRGARRIEVLRYGANRPGAITSAPMRAHYDDGRTETVEVDFGAFGFNVESLMRTVAWVNAELARQPATPPGE
jgi:hypothetical protein